MKFIRTILTTIILIFAGTFAATPASADTLTPTTPTYASGWFTYESFATLDDCEYEDGWGQNACKWDARTRGNGQGDTLVNFAGGRVTLHLDGSVDVWVDRSIEPVHWSGITDGVPACEVEDGSTQDVCLWNAQAMGNGQGESFVSMDYGNVTIYENGTVHTS